MSSKLWFRVGAAAALSLALGTTISFAQDHGGGHDKHDRDDDRDHGNDREHGNGHEHGDARGDAARGWYRAHYSHLPPDLARRDHLPPGLERQLVVRGTLPPGLRVQMHPCPHELEVMFPPPPPNYMHVVVGGNLVLVNRANFQIADVFHLQIH